MFFSFSIKGRTWFYSFLSSILSTNTLLNSKRNPLHLFSILIYSICYFFCCNQFLMNRTMFTIWNLFFAIIRSLVQIGREAIFFFVKLLQCFTAWRPKNFFFSFSLSGKTWFCSFLFSILSTNTLINFKGHHLHLFSILIYSIYYFYCCNRFLMNGAIFRIGNLNFAHFASIAHAVGRGKQLKQLMQEHYAVFCTLINCEGILFVAFLFHLLSFLERGTGGLSCFPFEISSLRLWLRSLSW